MYNKDAIIDLVKKNNNASFYFLVKKLNIPKNENKYFSIFLNQMKKDGDIALDKKNDVYYIPFFVTNVNSELKLKSNEYGFVEFELNGENKKAIIFKNNLNNSINNDVVNVNIYKDKNFENQYFAIIKNIVTRKTKFLFGIINQNKEFEPINFSNKYIFFFDKKQLEENTYVKFEIQSINKNEIFLNLIKNISKIDVPYSDIEFVVESLEIDQTFNEKVKNESKLIPNEVEKISDDKRVDLTNKLVVTIDGEKTKDFDDAISVKKNNNDEFILHVHIADVAYYVKENSEIDKQALSRATSIYLIDKVIPMLPEQLSNGICSLNPNVNRYALTLEVLINKQGKILNKKIYPSTINSKYRLTYKEVANYQNESSFLNDNNLKMMIENAYELSNILLKNKKEQGYIDFEIEEAIIDLDQNGKTINIHNKKRLSSEILIENFMVLANEVVSKMISDLKFPSIYRVHEHPSEEKFQSLEEVIKILSLKDIHVKHSDDPKKFAQLVEKIKKQRFDEFIKVSLLRTMQKAKYSTHNIGHFGLASKYYSHFTSPIRRYPDLALHRLIWELIINKNYSYLGDLENKLNNIASISSQKEEEATNIERKILDVKKAEFYENKINKIYNATIVSIQKFGIFVELENNVDVFIHTSKISSNICKINETNTMMEYEPKKYLKLGQQVKTKIISINKLEGKIDGQLIF